MQKWQSEIVRRITAGRTQTETPMSPTERALISSWRFGHISREELEEKIGKSRADYLAPTKK